MATFLSKLFKPKWQSKHIETRKQALTELDGFNSDDLKILTQLAESDPSLDVQQLAIQKISDTDVLISLHKKAKDALKTSLESRLYEIASAQSLSIFDLIIDQDLLTDMIIKSNQSDSYIRGLARIQDSSTLLKIATQSRNAQIRQAAAELLETEKELSELFSHAKGKDKTVYQITKTKLAEIRAIAQKEAEEQALIEKLLKDLDNLSKTEAVQHFDARLSHIEKQWAQISAKANTAQNNSYSDLRASCQQKLASLETVETKPEPLSRSNESHHREDEPEAASEIEQTISTIRDTLVRFQQQAAKALEISALDALIKTQENRWLEATRTSDVSKAHQISYQDGMTQLRHYLKAMHALAEQSEPVSAAIEALVNAELLPKELETKRKQLGAALNSINWPNQFKTPDIIVKAQGALNISKERQEAFAEKQKEIEVEIDKQISQLDLALDDKKIKEAIKQLKDIQSNLNKLDSKRSDKFLAGISLRKNQLNELKDWQGFVSTPKQEELCVAMERLVETHIDPADKADKIKAMQQEWKRLGGTGDQALWNRFKTAADKAFEPCALFFAEQKQLKEANLNKRKTLLTQLNEYLTSIDWEKVSSQNPQTAWQISDWKAAEKISRQAKQEWRDAFPIDFKSNKPLQIEFNTLMSSFDEHLEAERKYNLSLKEKVVEEAQLLTHSEDIDASIQAIKSLQETWQKIGITHHKADRKLWSEYRSACDEVFAKRNQVREEKRSELDAAINEANTICQTIEETCVSLSDKTTDELKALLSANRKSTDALPSVPVKVREKLLQRLEQVNKNIKTAIHKKDQHEKLAEWKEVARKASILRYAYDTAISNNGKSEPTDSTPDAFVSKIPLPSDIEQQLESAWKDIIEGNIQKLTVIDEVKARELCIASEVAAGIESPSEDKSLRMQLQVSRLSEGLSSSSENISREAQLEKTLSHWYLSFGLSAETLAKLETRIEAAKNALLAP